VKQYEALRQEIEELERESELVGDMEQELGLA
jgi:hypothetical protein